MRGIKIFYTSFYPLFKNWWWFISFYLPVFETEGGEERIERHEKPDRERERERERERDRERDRDEGRDRRRPRRNDIVPYSKTKRGTDHITSVPVCIVLKIYCNFWCACVYLLYSKKRRWDGPNGSQCLFRCPQVHSISCSNNSTSLTFFITKNIYGSKSDVHKIKPPTFQITKWTIW